MQKREGFSSKLGVILATVGSAVGLGNIWRFPYVTGENGGGAFLLIYIICIAFIGIPMLMAEFMIGRHAKLNAVGSFKQLAPKSAWFLVGGLGVLTGFVIMAFYYVVTGWTFEYVYESVLGHLSGKSTEEYQSFFTDFMLDPYRPILTLSLAIIAVHLVIVQGVQKGIEKLSKILMPAFFLLMLVLAFHSLFLNKAAEGLRFLFMPDLSKLSAQVFLQAMGQAFFSLSLGMGCIITYASYFDDKLSIPKTALQVAFLDLAVALLAAIIIFPAVFTFDVELSAGPGLAFVSLPNIFDQMPMPIFWSSLFYILLALAAFTSIISLHEVVTAFVLEEFKLTRKRATMLVSLTTFVLACIASLSLNPANTFFSLFGKSLFDIFDYASATIMLPLGGIGASVFVGWYLDKKIIAAQLTNQGSRSFKFLNTYIFLLKFIVPICILAVFIGGLLGLSLS